MVWAGLPYFFRSYAFAFFYGSPDIAKVDFSALKEICHRKMA